MSRLSVRRWSMRILVACAIAGGAACDLESPEADTAAAASSLPAACTPLPPVTEINPRLLRRFQPVTPPETSNADVVRLGRRLFEDSRLSADGKVSCVSCHALDRHGADGRAVSVGVNGALGRRNAPSVFNATFQSRLMWDGRAGTLEEQATLPFLHPSEMGMSSMDRVVAVLAGDSDYSAMFRAAFPGVARPVSPENVVRAIAAFERTLVTRGRWDRYLEGERDALTTLEKAGLRHFLNAGCMVCHTGKNLGGLTFERAGVVVPWPNQDDQGRAEITFQEADRMVFRVPSLRNVAETAPYFHDGSVAHLEEAVVVMGRHQLGLELTPPEAASIATWLRSLTGEVPSGAPPASVVAIAPVTAARRAACGSLGAPPCPLQAWMRGSARPALERRSFNDLMGMFTQIARFAPSGFSGWSALANEGRVAAAKRDLDGVRGACEACHATFRERYRREAREQALP